MNDLKELAAQVVAAYVSHNPIAASALPLLLAEVYDALSLFGKPTALNGPILPPRAPSQFLEHPPGPCRFLTQA